MDLDIDIKAIKLVEEFGAGQAAGTPTPKVPTTVIGSSVPTVPVSGPVAVSMSIDPVAAAGPIPSSALQAPPTATFMDIDPAKVGGFELSPPAAPAIAPQEPAVVIVGGTQGLVDAMSAFGAPGSASIAPAAGRDLREAPLLVAPVGQ
jgi:hypothetical protein